MLDDNLIGTLEQNVRQTRNLQHRLEAQLHDKEAEVELLRLEIKALDNSAAQTEQTIDSLLVAMQSGNRSAGVRRSMTIEDDYELGRNVSPRPADRQGHSTINNARSGSVAYFNPNIIQNRGIPPITNNIQPVSNRFSDRTITQACTLLLREHGSPLHVNELYNMLVSGGMRFKGNNPTISIAVSLNRNRRFRKVDPGTFDLVMREAIQAAS